MSRTACLGMLVQAGHPPAPHHCLLDEFDCDRELAAVLSCAALYKQQFPPWHEPVGLQSRTSEERGGWCPLGLSLARNM